MPGPLGHQQIGAKPSRPEARGRGLADLTIPGSIGRTSEVPKAITTGGATVWAYRVGDWSRAPGWGHVFEFRGLGDLISSMEDAGLQGKVSQLGIVAHGDLAGRIELDRDLTVETMPRFYADLATLTRFLSPDAWVTFYSCIAGSAKEGSELLISISKHLRGRTIVGFVLYGLIGPGKNAAGAVKASETQYPSVAMDPKQHATHGYLDPWCRFAKRAKDGRIVHIPILEQNSRPGFACANPACPGHGEPSHSCIGW